MSSLMDSFGMDEEELQQLYTYVDSIPLSRPKKNIARDFSDAVLMAEVVKHYYPRLVQLHNYSAANSVKRKIYNWNTLNQKVLKKLQFHVSKKEIENIANCVPGAIEKLLHRFQIKITELQEQGFDPTVVVGKGRLARLAEGSVAGGILGGSEIAGHRRHGEPERGNRRQFSGSGGGSSNNSSRGVDGGGGGGGSSVGDDSQEFREMLGDIGIDYPFGGKDSGNFRHRRDVHETAADEDKDAKIAELQDTVHLLEQKINKLTMLVRLKDSKITTLTTKLKEAGIMK